MRLQAIRVYSARGACRLDAGKFTCFTGKLPVMQVNCVWGLFTFELQVNYLRLQAILHAPVLQCIV